MTTIKEITFGAILGALLIWGGSGMLLTYAEVAGYYGPCTDLPELTCLKAWW